MWNMWNIKDVWQATSDKKKKKKERNLHKNKNNKKSYWIVAICLRQRLYQHIITL